MPKNYLESICCHEKDFKTKVISYDFFVITHGKSLCDAVGDIIKRLITQYCLKSNNPS